ncbi:MAG: RNA polymerase sigma factor [Bdellovibrionales bacterium]|nr:RNA polymerase sigma factor [Bdellovibrionales bacterium]
MKNGDRQAFELLFEHYQGAVVSYAYTWVKNQDHAEEIAQEAFLKIYRVRESYEPTASFVSWLWTIVRNTALDFLRKKKEFLMDPLTHDESEGSSGSSPIDEIESPLSDAEALLIEETDRLQIERCMGKITAPQKEALQLRLVSELSYEQIAAILKTTVSAVKSSLNRAKTALMECFKRSRA